MDKIQFNSFLDRESYSVIKAEAFKENVTVKIHISNILRNYAETKRKEGLTIADLLDESK